MEEASVRLRGNPGFSWLGQKMQFAIAFNQAIVVAALGLLVNGVSVALLGVEHGGSGESDEQHEHGAYAHVRHDHNLRSAYLHVLADALTSVLAIVAISQEFL